MSDSETIKQRVEREAREALEAAHNRATVPTPVPMKECHWCDGVVVETPTKGRLECRTCGAVSIVGRQVPVIHVSAT